MFADELKENTPGSVNNNQQKKDSDIGSVTNKSNFSISSLLSLDDENHTVEQDSRVGIV